MKRRAFTLIETVICLSLLSVLLGSLFFWYHHLSVQKSRLQGLKWPILEERYAQQRLDLFLRAAQKELFFTPEINEICFRFQRGSHPDPLLAGTIVGSLFCARDGLFLKIWPNSLEEEPSQLLKILDEIENPEFWFYFPEDPFKLTISPDEVGKEKPLPGWQSTWKKEYQTLPALIKLKFQRNGYPLEYVFDLDHPILYAHEAT